MRHCDRMSPHGPRAYPPTYSAPPRQPRPRAAARFAAALVLATGLAALSLVVGRTPVRAETRAGGKLVGALRWTKAESPYVIIQDLEIPAGSSLTLEPGVVVRFKPNLNDQKGLRPFDLELVVRGLLTAQGADGDSVYLTSDAVDVNRGDWSGIVVPEAGGKVVLDRTVIEFANQGIFSRWGDVQVTRSQFRSCSMAGIQLQQSTGRITRSIITDNGNFGGTGKGIYLIECPDVLVEGNLVIGNQNGLALERGSNSRVVNNLFSLCLSYGITVAGSDPELTRNNITQNEYGIYLYGNSRPRVRDNNIFQNGSWEVKVGEYSKLADGKNQLLDLGGNWWGDITPDVILDKIDDGLDDPAVGAVVKIDPVRKDAWRSAN